MDKQWHSLTPENPWQGLNAYEESDSAYFHGREGEVKDLLGCLKRERLTVLFGRSGLGKTSILNAGLFPKLRSQDYLPVYLRLNFYPEAQALRQQILQALAEASKVQRVEVPRWNGEETLWEMFHRPETEFRGENNRLLTPVLVFDQFEETFIQGLEQESAFAKTKAFLVEFADWIENRTSAALKAQFDADPDSAQDFDFAKSDFKVIISFREDYLAHAEALKTLIPSITHNHYRLLPMSGSQAHAVITSSGGHLVEEGIPEKILALVAAEPHQFAKLEDTVDYSEFEIDPVLLSVICRELNLKRNAENIPRINAALITAGEGDQILGAFYERSLAKFNPALRAFVEDELLTDKGYRNSYIYDDAVSLPGINEESLMALVRCGLLRMDERSEVLRLELTQDVLTEVVKTSRDLRLAREAEVAAKRREQQALKRQRRNRILSVLLVSGVLYVTGATLYAQRLWHEVDELHSLALIHAKSLLLSQSRWFQSRQLDLGMLLNVEAQHLAQQIPNASHDDVKAGFAAGFNSFSHLDGFFPANGKLFVVTYNADGRLMATGAENGEIQIWDVQEKRVIQQMKGHEDAVLGLSFSNDGQWLASAGKDKKILLWDTVVWRNTRPALLGHTAAVESVMFSPNSKNLVSASDDGSVRLWDVAGSSLVKTLSAHAKPVLSLAFSPDGKFLSYGMEDKLVGLLDLTSGQERLLAGHEDRVLAVAFGPDSRLLASAGQDQQIIFWDVARGIRVGAPPQKHSGAIRSLAFSANGKRMVSAGEDQSPIVWDVLDQGDVWGAEFGFKLEGHQGVVRKVMFHPDGNHLVSASDDHQAIQWNLVQNNSFQQLDVAPAPVGSLAYSPDGRWLATGDDKGRIRIWDTHTAKSIPPLPPLHDGPVVALAYSDDGRYLASASENKQLIFWELKSNPTDALPKPKPIKDQTEVILALAFKPDSHQLVSATESGAVEVWDVEAGQRKFSLPLSDKAFRSVAYHPAGKLIALAGDSGKILVLDVDSKSKTLDLVADGQSVYALRFSPDGKWLATAGHDAVYLWEVATGKQLGILSAHEGSIHSLDFNRGGNTLAVGGDDGSFLLWSLPQQKLFASLAGHRGGVLAVNFSPDTLAIATAGNDGKVLLWDWNAETMADRACRIANRNLSCGEWNDYLGGSPYRKTCGLLPDPQPPCP